jgi:plastocyanin
LFNLSFFRQHIALGRESVKNKTMRGGNVKQTKKLFAVLGLLFATAFLMGVYAQSSYNYDSSGTTNSGSTNNAVSANAQVDSTNTVVDIKNDMYSSDSITINIGDKVTWRNTDSIAHTVLSNDGSTELNSQVLNPGDEYSHTFSSPGEFSYSDPNYPNIEGVVMVEDIGAQNNAQVLVLSPGWQLPVHSNRVHADNEDNMMNSGYMMQSVPPNTYWLKENGQKILMTYGADNMMNYVGSDGTNIQQNAYKVNISNSGLSDNVLSINTGDSVTWTNVANTANPMIVKLVSSGISGDYVDEIDSPNLNSGDTYVHTFNVAGTYTYFDMRHPDIHGVILVSGFDHER